MWRPFVCCNPWDLTQVYVKPAATSDATKDDYELRVLSMLLPAALIGPPTTVTKRESPDFEVITTTDTCYVEVVDAVPDAISASGTENIARRRSRPNNELYRVDGRQFGGVIAREVAKKIRKAEAWLVQEPRLRGRLALAINGDQGGMNLRDYLRDPDTLRAQVPITSIAPFSLVILGDRTGAFVWVA